MAAIHPLVTHSRSHAEYEEAARIIGGGTLLEGDDVAVLETGFRRAEFSNLLLIALFIACATAAAVAARAAAAKPLHALRYE